jgi:hypothetical protein
MGFYVVFMFASFVGTWKKLQKMYMIFTSSLAPKKIY